MKTVSPSNESVNECLSGPDNQLVADINGAGTRDNSVISGVIFGQRRARVREGNDNETTG